MPLKALRFVRKMRGGAQAHLIEAHDGNYYVVKFRNNPQHRRILVNECRQRLRRRARERIRPLAALAEPAEPDSSGSLSARDAVSRAISRLDADHRIVVILRYWADLSVDEIAARLDVPAGTVKSRLHYALRSMRPKLEGDR